MASHNIKRDYGLRACAGLSMLSAFLMIFMSVYVFVARLEELNPSKFRASHVPPHISSTEEDPEAPEKYGRILRLMNALWIKNRPVLVSSSMLAILGGLLQTIFCGLVILSDAKAMQLYIRKWVLVHFILLIVLLIILLNTIVLTETSIDKESWDGLTANLMKYLKQERPVNQYEELFRFLGAGQILIYVGVSVNMAMILVLMGTTLYLMRSHPGDYESCE